MPPGLSTASLFTTLKACFRSSFLGAFLYPSDRAGVLGTMLYGVFGAVGQCVDRKHRYSRLDVIAGHWL